MTLSMHSSTPAWILSFLSVFSLHLNQDETFLVVSNIFFEQNKISFAIEIHLINLQQLVLQYILRPLTPPQSEGPSCNRN